VRVECLRGFESTSLGSAVRAPRFFVRRDDYRNAVFPFLLVRTNRMSESYRTSRRVEFRDTDAAGIVHFSVFFTWMEAAEHEFLRSLGLSVVLKDGAGTITWPRVAARCDYQGPVRFEELVDVEVHVAKIGAKSVTYEFHFTGPHGAIAAGQMTVVCCRIEADGTFRSIYIPEAFRQAIAAYAPA
jgi:acyl-CoA thioester hydrolase